MDRVNSSNSCKIVVACEETVPQEDIYPFSMEKKFLGRLEQAEHQDIGKIQAYLSALQCKYELVTSIV